MLRDAWFRFPALLLVAAFGAGAPASALGQEGRSLEIALFAGARSFESRFDLSSELAAGGRLGLDINRHTSVLMDAVYTTPSRTTTGAFTRVTSIRALLRYRLLSGSVHPYIMGGAGGMLFDFEDTPDASGGTFTGGVGLEWSPMRRLAVFGEGSIDWYLNRYVTYAPTGQRLTISDRTTEQIRTFSAGVLTRF